MPGEVHTLVLILEVGQLSGDVILGDSVTSHNKRVALLGISSGGDGLLGNFLAQIQMGSNRENGSLGIKGGLLRYALSKLIAGLTHVEDAAVLVKVDIGSAVLR